MVQRICYQSDHAILRKVYSEKTGKKLYTLKSVSGFRIAEYKRNIYGVVPYNSIPVSVITYGTLDNPKWIKAYNRDVEI